MMISIDAFRAYNKIQNALMIKKLSRNFLNVIKDIYFKNL